MDNIVKILIVFGALSLILLNVFVNTYIVLSYGFDSYSLLLTCAITSTALIVLKILYEIV